MAALLLLLGTALALGALIQNPTSDGDGLDDGSIDFDENLDEPMNETSEPFDGSFDLTRNGASSGNLDQTDFLVGGEGTDLLIGGHNDVLSAGGGSDVFVVNVDNTIYIQDYEESDQIWIEHQGLPPTISLDATDEGLSILADGSPVAMLREIYEISPENIFLFSSN